MNEKLYTNLKVTECDNSEIEIEAEISAENLVKFRKKALDKLSKDAKIPGFRPGHIPEKILMERAGEQGILEEASEMALGEAYPEIVKDEKLNVIGRPNVTIVKLASGNPFIFKIKTAVMPEVILPKYKEIADKQMAKKETVEVSSKEIDDVIVEIQKTRAQVDNKKDVGEDADLDKTEEKKDENLPELTDEFVKSLGDFKDVADFKVRIKENMLKEKEMHEKEKKRIAMSDEIIKESKISLPQVLVTAELEKMSAQFKDDVAKMGMDFEDYLKKIEKTEEALHEEWKETAEKRAKMQLILNKIAVEEKLIPDATEVETQVNHLLEHYKDADQERVRVYVETLLTNEKVFNFLEGTPEEIEDEKEKEETAKK